MISRLLSACAHLCIRAAARLVPPLERDTFAREWEAEIHHAFHRADGALPGRLRITWRALLAFVDATALALDAMTLDTIARDLRFSLRALLKRPGFATLALLTLGLGIGANTAIFSVVDTVLLRPLPYPEPERIVALWEQDGGRDFANTPVSAQDFEAWQEEMQTLEHIAAGRPAGFALTGGGEPEQIPGIRVSADFFDVFGRSPDLGRAFTEEETIDGAHRVAVLSHALWVRRWGADPGVLGETIELDGERFEVIGVMPEGFAFPSAARIWTPLVISDQEYDDTGRHFLLAFGRMQSGTSLAQVDREIARIAERRASDLPRSNGGWTATAVSMHEQMTQNVRGMLWVLLGAVGFVLLIACGNVANLLLVRASGRQREMAVRAALGAGKGRLIRQVLTESVVLSAGGAILGLGIAWIALELMLGVGPIAVPGGGSVTIDLRVFGFAALVALGSGLLFGSVPAFSVWRSDLNRGLRAGARGAAGGPGGRMRDTLVVLEMAMALVLVTGAGLMLQSVNRMLDVDIGMDVQNVAVAGFTLPPARYPDPQERLLFYSTLLERAGQLPGVEHATLNPWLPPGGGPLLHVRIEGVHPEWTADLPLARMRAVPPGYFDAMGIPLLRGRDFSANDAVDSDLVAIVDQAFVDVHFPDEDPIGKRFRTLQDAPRTIVGVVGNVTNAGLTNDAGPTDYLPYTQAAFGFGQQLILKTSGDAEAAIPMLREVIWEADADLPLNGVGTLESRLRTSIQGPRFNAMLLGLFAALALVLAAIGIYGVMAFTVRERTRELGLRMALGATGAAVQSLVLRRAGLLVLAGVALGLLVSAGLTRMISTYLFGIQATDPRTLVGVVVLLCGVGLVASWVPAVRASRLDPQVALREE